MTLHARITQAAAALSNVSGLVAEAQAQIDLQSAALERIQVQNEEYQRLAALNEAEAEAVSRLVERTVEQAHDTLVRASRRDQLIGVLVGLLASVPIGIIVNLLTR